jgi:alkaline phosphatase D
MMMILIAALAATPAQGPVLGDLTATSVQIWMRLDAPGEALVNVYDPAGTKVWHTSVQAEADHDNTTVVTLTALTPETRYAYVIDGEHQPEWFFTTPPRQATHTRLAFASCAKEAKGSGRVWNRIDTLQPDGLVLLGDTPYIDSTDLGVQRRRYRAFAAFAPFAQLASHTPVYSTWDDHDFGRNDTDGRLKGKANSRRAVLEYRPNPSFGEADKGIYTSFRSGPVEVFLLDARWFARTEGVEGDWSLLGAQQWAWLERSLKASTAPFKVLATGMVFNGSVRPGKHDCWGAYRQEYDRLRTLIDGIDGVVLVSGDVHWSRELEHDPGDRADAQDWPLVEFVTSPVHEHLIAAANPPHPWLRWSRGEVNSFLMLDADERMLRMSFMNAAGEVLHNRVLRLAESTHQE